MGQVQSAAQALTAVCGSGDLSVPPARAQPLWWEHKLLFSSHLLQCEGTRCVEIGQNQAQPSCCECSSTQGCCGRGVQVLLLPGEVRVLGEPPHSPSVSWAAPLGSAEFVVLDAMVRDGRYKKL